MEQQLLNSSISEEEEYHMDIMTTMHYFPEFSDAVDEGFKLPSQFCGGAANTMPLADLINNNNPPIPWSSSSFTNSPFTTISFTNNNSTTQMLQQQEQTPPAMFSNSIKESWKPTNMSEATNPREKRNSMAAMREMIFRMAAMQPIHIDPESVKPPKRRNVKISKDPQSVAARHRRERISERIRILQRLVPGGTKMDTASMLDEAIHYVKFLKSQVQSLERVAATSSSSTSPPLASGIGFPVTMNPLPKPPRNVEYYGDV